MRRAARWHAFDSTLGACPVGWTCSNAVPVARDKDDCSCNNGVKYVQGSAWFDLGDDGTTAWAQSLRFTLPSDAQELESRPARRCLAAPLASSKRPRF